jgi:hypothetical protein
MAKDHEQYLRELRRQGYVTIRKTRSNHLRVFCPQGHLVSTHAVNGGSDYRGLRNFQSEVRRHELWHRDSDDRTQEPGRRNPVGDGETRCYRGEEPQYPEYERRDDQHPADQSSVDSHS